MANILCVWELGVDLGHLSNLRLPIEIAVQQGHKVYLAARQLHNVGTALGDLPVVCLQAPFKQSVVPADQIQFQSLTHLMARQCFSGVDELEMLLRAWQAIFDLTQPGLVVFESSPTALIAAAPYPFKKVLAGSGFFIPPGAVDGLAPFAVFPTTPRTPRVMQGLQSDDAVVLQLVNLARGRLGHEAELASLQSIFSQAHQRFLMTLPCIDHYGERGTNPCYLGSGFSRPYAQPFWPAGVGAKVFVYLHAVSALENLLQGMRAAGLRVLLFVRGISVSLQNKYASDSMRFVDRPVDLAQVALEADWVVNHGNHGTVSTFVKAGVPQLLIPLHQEHLFVALRLQSAGSAVLAYQDQPDFSAEIAALNGKSGLRDSAAVLAAQCQRDCVADPAEFISRSLHSLLHPS